MAPVVVKSPKREHSTKSQSQPPRLQGRAAFEARTRRLEAKKVVRKSMKLGGSPTKEHHPLSKKSKDVHSNSRNTKAASIQENTPRSPAPATSSSEVRQPKVHPGYSIQSWDSSNSIQSSRLTDFESRGHNSSCSSQGHMQHTIQSPMRMQLQSQTMSEKGSQSNLRAGAGPKGPKSARPNKSQEKLFEHRSSGWQITSLDENTKPRYREVSTRPTFDRNDEQVRSSSSNSVSRGRQIYANDVNNEGSNNSHPKPTLCGKISKADRLTISKVNRQTPMDGKYEDVGWYSEESCSNRCPTGRILNTSVYNKEHLIHNTSRNDATLMKANEAEVGRSNARPRPMQSHMLLTASVVHSEQGSYSPDEHSIHALERATKDSNTTHNPSCGSGTNR